MGANTPFHLMLTAAMSIGLSACAGAAKPEPLTSLPGDSHWRLQGSDVTGLEGGAATGIRLSVEDDGLSGDSGCNRFQAPVSFEGATVQIGSVVSTKRACLEAERNQAERALYEALPQIQHAFQSDGELRFELADGRYLVFSRDSEVGE